MIAPTLHTARLTLGPASAAHAEAFIAFCASDASRFLGGPVGPRDAWEGVAIVAGLWTLRGYGPFWMTESATGAPVGRVGIYYPIWRDEPELAWLVYPAYQRQGFGYEGAVAARDWAYATLGLAPLVSLIDPKNTASIRLAEKLGAVCEGPQNPEDADSTLCWRHPAQAVAQ
ncbi:GNAT family N-acetyltransferase [Phaeovulum sp.]|uniref:GNAT family N-acetyltransferase n=1 Tax=Phaeovulum sp. TaxID=2934796 RepID=UPI003566CAAF